jgi:acyl carrier protein
VSYLESSVSVPPYHQTRAQASAPDDAVLPRLREIVADVAELAAGEVGVDELFYDDLLLDSLQKLEIVVRIERAFGVKLSHAEAAGLDSLADALALVRARRVRGQ